MSQLRMYCLFDAGVNAYLQPFWCDHKTNALRGVTRLVNEKSTDSMVATHPDQFFLFELGIFSLATGVFTSHAVPQPLGCLVEFVQGVNSQSIAINS